MKKFTLDGENSNFLWFVGRGKFVENRYNLVKRELEIRGLFGPFEKLVRE